MFMITLVRMNILRIRLWFLCQRWKNRMARWHGKLRHHLHRGLRSTGGSGHRPRLEQLRLPFD